MYRYRLTRQIYHPKRTINLSFGPTIFRISQSCPSDTFGLIWFSWVGSFNRLQARSYANTNTLDSRSQFLCRSCRSISFNSLDSPAGHHYHQSWADVIRLSPACHLCWKIRYYIESLQAQYGVASLSHITKDPDFQEAPAWLCLRRETGKKAIKDASRLIVERRATSHEAKISSIAEYIWEFDSLCIEETSRYSFVLPLEPDVTV